MANNCSFSVSSCDTQGWDILESSRCLPKRGRYIHQLLVIPPTVKAAIKCGTQQDCENDVLAGNPRGRPLIFPAIGDLAFFAAGNELENNFFAAVQAGPSVIFGGRKDQPVSSQNFVRTSLGEDLITTIGIHFQGRRRAVARLSRDFNAHAIIGSREGCLRPCRLAAEDQAHGAQEENFRYVVFRSVMASQS